MLHARIPRWLNVCIVDVNFRRGEFFGHVLLSTFSFTLVRHPLIELSTILTKSSPSPFVGITKMEVVPVEEDRPLAPIVLFGDKPDDTKLRYRHPPMMLLKKLEDYPGYKVRDIPSLYVQGSVNIRVW